MGERLNFAKGRGKISTGKYAPLKRLVVSKSSFHFLACEFFAGFFCVPKFNKRSE